jgi:hypothetical protein
MFLCIDRHEQYDMQRKPVNKYHRISFQTDATVHQNSYKTNATGKNIILYK